MTTLGSQLGFTDYLYYVIEILIWYIIYPGIVVQTNLMGKQFKKPLSPTF